MFRLIIALGLLSALPAHAADPLHTDGDKYKVRFENDRVRVLEYSDKPGDRTHSIVTLLLFFMQSFRSSGSWYCRMARS